MSSRVGLIKVIMSMNEDGRRSDGNYLVHANQLIVNINSVVYIFNKKIYMSWGELWWAVLRRIRQDMDASSSASTPSSYSSVASTLE